MYIYPTGAMSQNLSFGLQEVVKGSMDKLSSMLAPLQLSMFAGI